MSGPAPELLDVGRPPPSRRRLLVGLAVALFLAGGAWAADERVRGSEAAAVEACRTQATQVVDLATGRLTSMMIYARPALTWEVPRAVREDLYRLISRSVEGAAPRVLDASRDCAEVDVLWWHRDLRRRRDGCVRELELRAEHLDAISLDARAYFDDPELPDPGC